MSEVFGRGEGHPFSVALSEALLTSNVTQKALAQQMPAGRPAAKQRTISRWCNSKLAQPTPQPADVQAIERALGLNAGDLAQHLGYAVVEPVPADASSFVASSIEEAVAADPRLTESRKQLVLDLVRELRADPVQTHGLAG